LVLSRKKDGFFLEAISGEYTGALNLRQSPILRRFSLFIMEDFPGLVHSGEVEAGSFTSCSKASKGVNLDIGRRSSAEDGVCFFVDILIFR